MDIPTREDLYAMVDEMFRSMYPQAPATLNPNRAAHHDWIYSWNYLKESILAEETNRVYWATFPDAPTKIDPSDPSHQPYVERWNEIAEAIRTNGDMVTGTASFIDYSHVTADLLEQAKIFEDDLGPIYPAVRDWLREAADDLIAAFQDGRVDDHAINGESKSFETNLPAPAAPTLTVTPMAWYNADGSPGVGLAFEPLTSEVGFRSTGP